MKFGLIVVYLVLAAGLLLITQRPRFAQGRRVAIDIESELPPPPAPAAVDHRAWARDVTPVDRGDTARPNASVSGTLEGPDGARLAGGVVALLRLDGEGRPSGAPLATARTDEDGSFALAFEAAGDVVIVLFDPREDAASRPLARPLRLAPGASPLLGNLRLPASVELGGRVELHPSCESPVDSVRLLAERADEAALRLRVGSTDLSWSSGAIERDRATTGVDRDGRFRFAGLGPGPHALRVVPDSLGANGGEPREGSSFAEPLLVVEAPEADVRLASRLRAVRFAVRCGERPLPGARVHAEETESRAVVTATADDAGRAVAVLDAEALWELHFEHADARTRVLALRPASLPADLDVCVALLERPPPGEVLLRMRGSAADLLRIHGVGLGVVRAADFDAGRGTVPFFEVAEGERVRVFWPDAPSELVVAREPDGSVRLSGVPAGTYELLPRAAVGDDGPQSLRTLSPSHLRVEVAPGEVTEVEWRLEPAALAELVLSHAAAPWRVRAWLENAAGERFELSRRSSPLRLTLQAPVQPGDYTLVVRQEAQERLRRPLALLRGAVRRVEVELDP